MGMMYMPGAAPEGPYYFGGDYPFGTRLRINDTAARYVLAKTMGGTGYWSGSRAMRYTGECHLHSSRLLLVLR